jgi:hypothetical protein
VFAELIGGLSEKGYEKMNPEHEERRKIIREWMSLSKDKRQTKNRLMPLLTKQRSESRPFAIRIER